MARGNDRWDEAKWNKLSTLALGCHAKGIIKDMAEVISKHWPLDNPNEEAPSPRVIRDRLAQTKKQGVSWLGNVSATTGSGSYRSNAKTTPTSGSGANNLKRKATDNAAADDGELSEDSKTNIIKGTPGTSTSRLNQKLGITRPNETTVKRRKINKPLFSDEESEHHTETESSDTPNIDPSATKPSSSKLVTTPRKPLARRSKTPKRYELVSDGEPDADAARTTTRGHSDSADSEFDYNAHKRMEKGEEPTTKKAAWRNTMAQDNFSDFVELED